MNVRIHKLHADLTDFNPGLLTRSSDDAATIQGHLMLTCVLELSLSLL